MAGAVDRAQTGLVAQFHGHGEVLHRAIAERPGAQGVGEAKETLGAGQHLAIGEGQRALGPGGDGEDAGLEEASAHIFQQGRVQVSAHNGVVDGPGLVLVQQLTLQHLAVHGHLKIAHRGVPGQGEDEGALHLAAARVAEDLGHGHLGHRAVDGGVDLVLADGDHRGQRGHEDRGHGRLDGPRRRHDALGM